MQSSRLVMGKSTEHRVRLDGCTTDVYGFCYGRVMLNVCIACDWVVGRGGGSRQWERNTGTVNRPLSHVCSFAPSHNNFLGLCMVCPSLGSTFRKSSMISIDVSITVVCPSSQ